MVNVRLPDPKLLILNFLHLLATSETTLCKSVAHVKTKWNQNLTHIKAH